MSGDETSERTGGVAIRRPQRRRPVFHRLPVVAIDRLTDDAVAVTLAIDPGLRQQFSFQPGQHLTLRLTAVDELRRSYSICSTPRLLLDEGLVRIGVREVAGGVFSRHALRTLRVGDEVEVMPPLGHFTTELDPTRQRHYAAIVAGSGITPVLSLLASAMETEPESRFTVLYGNRRSATVMFVDELADLKDRYPQRVHVVHVLSREPQLSPLLSGRLDADCVRSILDTPLLDVASVDEWFLCGPYGMVMDARAVLADRGVGVSAIRAELFHVDSAPPQGRPSDGDIDSVAGARLTVRLAGRESTVVMRAGERVLDAALRVRAELPYACRGGVCSTCRAKLVTGAVSMAQNYALEPDELAAGYVLTCQSTPTTTELAVDYDA